MSAELVPAPDALRALGVEPVRDKRGHWMARAADLAELPAPDVRAAAQLALRLAVDALSQMRADEIPPAVAVRLLDIGTRLERGSADVPAPIADDPWDVIARELAAGTAAAVRDAQAS